MVVLVLRLWAVWGIRLAYCTEAGQSRQQQHFSARQPGPPPALVGLQARPALCTWNIPAQLHFHHRYCLRPWKKPNQVAGSRCIIAWGQSICPAVRLMSLYIVHSLTQFNDCTKCWDTHFFGTTGSIKPFHVLMLFFWWNDVLKDW